MTDAIIKLSGTDLASRQTAATVRYNVASAVSAGNRVVIYIAEIESMSYADELFCVIAATRGSTGWSRR